MTDVSTTSVEVIFRAIVRLVTQFAGADPGFSERGFGQTSAYII